MIPIDKRILIPNPWIELNANSRIPVSFDGLLKLLLIGLRILQHVVVHGRGDARFQKPNGRIGNIIIDGHRDKHPRIQQPRFERVVYSSSLKIAQTLPMTMTIDQARDQHELISSELSRIWVSLRKLIIRPNGDNAVSRYGDSSMAIEG